MARAMQDALNNRKLLHHKTCFALHHAQVSTDPYNFFVINSNLDGLSKNYKQNDLIVVCNPKIVEKDKESKKYMLEGCMSYSYKQDKTMLRYTNIKVFYESLVIDEEGNASLEPKIEWLEDISAQIFQHECEHGFGIAIY